MACILVCAMAANGRVCFQLSQDYDHWPFHEWNKSDKTTISLKNEFPLMIVNEINKLI